MSKSRRSLLLLTLLLTDLSLTSILQLSQTANSQQDYEELIITEPNNDQKLIQPSSLSNIRSVEAQQELQYSYLSEWGSSGRENGQFQLPWSLTLDSQVMCMLLTEIMPTYKSSILMATSLGNGVWETYHL